MAAVRHLGFWKVGNFNLRPSSEAQYASSYQISRILVEPFRRYGRFSIFQYGGQRRLGFWKFQIFSKRQRITLRLLNAIAIPSVVYLSVCLSPVTLVHPTQAVELFGNFFSPYDSKETLLFWCQKSLVGDAPFPLKFAFKVTHPLSNNEISTNIGS